jgi:predicted signal transduction protein with EAL and GGDEF domain
MGLCLYADHFTEDFDTLLRYADHALYRSKANKHERSRYWEMFTLEEKHDNTDQIKQNVSTTPTKWGVDVEDDT